MQLAINSRGAYIRKSGECFSVKTDEMERAQEISAAKVESILISTSVLISTDAIKLAFENNIEIVFMDDFGNPYSRVWHSKFGSTAFIRRKQLEFSENEEGLALVKSWISEKLSNQIFLLEKLKKTRESKKTEVEKYIEILLGNREKLEALSASSIDEIRNQVLGFEGAAGRFYFEAVNFIIPDRYKFSGRSRNPAKDEFNAFLNYGYGILYSRVERACIIAGLDPYIGFLHTDNYGKKSFIFDLIELFRIHVDEIVIKLFSKRMVKKEMFREIKNGVVLDKAGKQLLISEFNKEMEKSVKYRNKNRKKKDIIGLEAHRIANNFIKENEDKNADMAYL